MSADLCGGRGSAELRCNERIQSPPWAVASAASRAGRGCECCIGRFLDKGVVSVPEIGGNRENEKTFAASILEPMATAKFSKLATAGCAFVFLYLQ